MQKKQAAFAAGAVLCVALAGHYVGNVQGADFKEASIIGASTGLESYYAGYGSYYVGEKASSSGISATLQSYYEAYENGNVSKSVTNSLTTMTSEEAAKRAAVLDEYSNLGVANVRNYLNVRKEPKSDGEIIGKMVKNSGCEILGETDGWYEIKSGSVTGYVSKDYILTGDDAVEVALAEADLRVVVTSDGNLNVRQEPNTSSKILDKISTDERYEVEEQLDGWIKIYVGSDEDGNDIYGYISSDYAEVRYALLEAVEFTPVSAESKLRTELCNYALQFLGNPYRWGGTSLTRGADCSGFVLSVYAHYGYSLPHSSRAQANRGTQVSSSEMQPGDLVFYSSGGRINHVAIYIGGGKIIHAANTNSGIIISRWNFRSPAKIVSIIND